MRGSIGHGIGGFGRSLCGTAFNYLKAKVRDDLKKMGLERLVTYCAGEVQKALGATKKLSQTADLPEWHFRPFRQAFTGPSMP